MSHHLDRRTALKWIATAAGSAFVSKDAAQFDDDPVTVVGHVFPPDGYGTDPDLLRDYSPGDLWPLSFTEHQRATAETLCGLIIPADGESPSASELHVHNFIDEWISSPYADQKEDRELVLFGLNYLDEISRNRYDSSFVHLDDSQQAALCDLMATMNKPLTKHDASAKEPTRKIRELQRAFRRFRELTAGGYFTTPEGLQYIGYVGNKPLSSFPKPPPEVLTKLGLE